MRGQCKVGRTMGDLPHYFDIILFAMVAAFLVLRLRAVLGRRSPGDERRPDPMLRRAEAPGAQIVGLKRLDVTDAGLAGRVARITVTFVSDQINVLRAHDASVVDGDPDHAIEKTDFWSFARDTGASDPNWVLEATASG